MKVKHSCLTFIKAQNPEVIPTCVLSEGEVDMHIRAHAQGLNEVLGE